MRRPRLRIPQSVVAIAAIAIVLLSACADSKIPPNLSNVDRICSTFCKRRAECVQGWDVSICEHDCRTGGGKLRGYYRPDYIDAEVRCAETAECDTINHRFDRVCRLDTRPPPSDAARDFCIALEQKDHDCYGKPVDVDKCLSHWGMLSDDVMTRLTSCKDERCRLYGECIRVQIGIGD